MTLIDRLSKLDGPDREVGPVVRPSIKRTKLDQFMIGRRFGRTVVMESAGFNSSRGRIWKMKCDCGKEHLSAKRPLVLGLVVSCGCFHKDDLIKCDICGRFMPTGIEYKIARCEPCKTEVSSHGE